MYEDVDAFYDEEVLMIIGNVDVHVPMVGDRALPRIPEAPEKIEKKGREAKDAEKAAREKDREKAAGARAPTAAPAKAYACFSVLQNYTKDGSKLNMPCIMPEVLL